MGRRKVIFIIFILLALIASAGAYYVYQMIYGPNIRVDPSFSFYVYPDDQPADILLHLKEEHVLIHPEYLDFVANQMSFDQSTTKPGRYTFTPKHSTFEVLDVLRQGKQTPIDLTIHGFRKANELAGYLGKQLMFDSLHYAQAIDVQSDSALCSYLPDTYEFYWSTSGAQFVERMNAYSDRYWADKTLTILGRPFTSCEAYILASIVEKESVYDPEKPDIAGVYINRLNRGMPLQADPTVIYGMNDFTIRRVLTAYLSVDSPYNTYLHAGLPPGPICMPSKSSLEAVVNASDHAYLYFCAKPDNSGVHVFAKTLAQHNRNAQAFQRWMNQRGIKR